jgi:two-component system cell cycle sensor histidine kinase PleC
MDHSAKADEYLKLRGKRDQRRRAAEDLKATRERLTSASGVKPEFEYELLAMFVRNEQTAAATIWALSAIFALASMFWAPVLQGCIWLTLVIASKVALLELCRRFNAADPETFDLAVWQRRFIMCEFLNGLTWAGFALVGVGDQDISNTALFSSHVFIFATLIVVLSIRMTFASTVLPILYAGTVPMTATVVGRLLMLNDPFYFALASMAVGVHVYFVFLAKGLRSTALAMLEYRAQKDSLIGELEEEKLRSDEARRRAEGANKAKSRFLATMSHELRTPLNAIMGFSEVMKSEVLGPIENPTYREYADSIHESGRHLLHLINEILDLSRIEAGRYELHEEPVRLTDVAEDCHRLLKLKAHAKGLEIFEQFEPGLSLVWVDQRAMRQICLNLMSNALKFTPKGGRITVTIATAENGGQLVSVKDTGPGIPAEEIPRVLQAFGQGSLAHETAEGGTGLGLPIVQNLIELHGGTFELKSELRKGTEAIVILPPRRVLATMGPLQPLGQERHKSPPPAKRPARQPRVLNPDGQLPGMARTRAPVASGRR